MTSIKPYESKDGTQTWRVRYRLQGRSCSKTFIDQRGAEMFGEMVDQWGPEQALTFIKQPVLPRAKVITVAEVVERYIALRAGATARLYRTLARLHINPDLGDLPVGKLTPEVVQLWILKLQVASGTIGVAHSVLSGALNLSVARGEIQTNPATKWSKTNLTGVRLPRARAKVQPIFLTEDEYAMALAQIPDHYKSLVGFLYDSGCRIGEALALTPADINLRTGKVRFNKTVSCDEDGKMLIGPTKTESSDREIAVPRLDELDLTHEYVFTMPSGGMILPNTFRTATWSRAMKKSGLPAHRTPRIHDLRHTHASRLLDAGISIHAVKARLGHSSVMTTLRTYGHAAEDSEARILEVL